MTKWLYYDGENFNAIQKLFLRDNFFDNGNFDDFDIKNGF